MWYVKLKVIVTKTSAKTHIKTFCKTCNLCAAFKKLQTTFLGPGFTQQRDQYLQTELCSLKYKLECKDNNFQTCIACHEKVFQQINYLKVDVYTGFNAGTCVKHFCTCIDETSSKTAVQICESQFSYRTCLRRCLILPP